MFSIFFSHFTSTSFCLSGRPSSTPSTPLSDSPNLAHLACISTCAIASPCVLFLLVQVHAKVPSLLLLFQLTKVNSQGQAEMHHYMVLIMLIQVLAKLNYSPLVSVQV